MNSLRGLVVNTKVEVEVDDPDYGGKYLSRVMDIDSRGIKLMAPTDHGELVFFRTKTPIKVFYIGDRALYAFTSKVIGRVTEPIPGIIIDVPAKVERIQRREYVRLEVKIPCYYRLIENFDTMDYNDNRPFIESHTIDVSGGGLRFLSSEELPQDLMLEFKLGIDDIKEDILVGKVVRVQKYQEEEGYEVGVAFEGLAPIVQDKIVSWIFDKQRDLRRKGLV